MAHYTGHISDSGIEALRATLNGKPIWSLHAPQVTAGFDGAPHEVHQLVFWIGKHDFVVLTTGWITTERGFDYHVYEIERSPWPGRIPYYPSGSRHKDPEEPSTPHLGLSSSLEVRLGEVERIEVIEACCSTTLPSDGDPETIDFDYGLQFIGTGSSILLTTSFDSILGAIEVRKGMEPELDVTIDTLRTRLLLERRTLQPGSASA